MLGDLGKTYAYDLADNLTQLTDANNKTTQFKYDALGNLTKVINTSLTKITDPFNLAVDYAYDSLNRLDTLTVEGKIFDYEFYPNGMLKAVNYPTTPGGQANIPMTTSIG